jgi:hypothetical protein
MKATTTPPSSTGKRWSKWLKLCGGALLLSAFGMQNWQNVQTALESERMRAAELQSRTMQKAIGYENLYFAAKAAGREDAESYLKLAAGQYFIGSTAMTVTAPGDKNERKVLTLRSAAEGVHDFDSFRRYIAVDNGLESQDHTIEVAGLTEPDTKARSYENWYLFLYVIGSVVALLGQALD